MNRATTLLGLRLAKQGAWVLPFLPLVARAQITGIRGGSNDAPREVDFASLAQIIDFGFNTAITVGGIVFVVLFLVAGVMYLTSAGNEDGTKKAKTLLVDAVIGLVLIVIAWAVGNYVLGLLNIQTDLQGDPGGSLELE